MKGGNSYVGKSGECIHTAKAATANVVGTRLPNSGRPKGKKVKK